jgi:PhnB protein
MSAPQPYLLLPGTAREALTFYHQVFGGELALHTFGEFGRDDGPPDAVAHGILQGPVSLFAADTFAGEATGEAAGEAAGGAAGGEEPFRTEGLMFSLLGAASATELRTWFDALAEGGTIRDALQVRPWGGSDGQVVDRYGLRWLIGFEDSEN